MNIFKTTFAVLSLFLIVTSAHADETAFDRVIKTKTLNCGYFIVPPYFSKDVNTGEMSGINYDMMEAIGKNLGLKINWKTEIGVGDVAASLSSNKIDVMCQTIWPSAARYSGMTFTNRPEFYSAIYAVARADDKRFDGDLSKANDKSIRSVGMEGDFSADMIQEKLPNAQHIMLPALNTFADYVMQLTTKKADILFMDKGSMNDFAKSNPGLVKIVPGIPATRIFGEHLVVKSGEYKLRDMLDMAELQLINDGVFEELVKSYKKKYEMDIYSSLEDIKK